MAAKRKLPERTPAERAYLAGIGRRVRARRHELGWTLEQLGERAQIHPTYVGGIERGERNVGVIKIGYLAATLEIDLGQLVTDLSPH